MPYNFTAPSLPTKARKFASDMISALRLDDDEVMTPNVRRLLLHAAALPLEQALFEGGVGDGVSDDTSAVLAAWQAASTGKGGVYIAPDGLYKTPGTFPIAPNYIEPTYMRFTKATRLALFDGSPESPNDIDDDPLFWTQKHVRYDNGTDQDAQSSSVVHDVIVYGSGEVGANDTDSTWNALIGNAVLLGTNQGTEGAPEYDLRGAAIGITGFARSEKPAGITTGLWGYAIGPAMSATEFAAYTAMSYPTVGIEVNIEIRTPDAGYKAGFYGAGVTAGFLGYNYRTQGAGVRDWSFGQLYSGSPNDGNFLSTDVDNWSGFYVGVRYDFIKKHGIEFGGYFKDGSYGIRFPDAYIGSQAPAAAIHLGNSKLQMGEYLGAIFANNDLWHSGGNLWFRYGAASRKLLQSNSGVVTLDADTVLSVTGGWNTRFSTVASAVNYFRNYNAATGGAPAITAEGPDPDIPVEIRPKGAAHLFTTSPIRFRPGASVNPVGNGDVVFQLTANTTLTVKARGSDGTVRSVDLALA